MIIAAICARGGSKGIPRKNLRRLGGKPLIAHTIECAAHCSTIDRIIVSTDDDEIAQVAQEYEAEVPFMRPSHLAQDDSSKWYVFRHLVETVERDSGEKISFLVDLDTGVPLRLAEDVDACVHLLQETPDAEIVVTAYESDRNPYFNMVELNSRGFAKIVKAPQNPIVSRQNAPDVYSLSPGVYVIRRDVLWKYVHWSQANMILYSIPRNRAVDIDSEFDFAMVEHLMAQKDRKLIGGINTGTLQPYE